MILGESVEYKITFLCKVAYYIISEMTCMIHTFPIIKNVIFYLSENDKQSEGNTCLALTLFLTLCEPPFLIKKGARLIWLTLLKKWFQ